MSSLSEQCQILGSSQSTIPKRRAALKQVSQLIGNSQSIARKLGKESITASINYLSIIDAAANLIVTDRAAASAKYKGEQFDCLRLLIECCDRYADQSLVECSLYGQVMTFLTELIAQYWSDTSVDEFMPRISHCFCSLINNPLRANSLSIDFLIQAFQYHGAALIALIHSKDSNSFITNKQANDITPFPMPSSFFANAQRCSTACSLILRSRLDQAQRFFEAACPVLEALFGKVSSSTVHPAFTFAATAELIASFSQSVRFHQSLIVDVIRIKLPAIIESIAAVWPRQHISSRATIMAKHSCISVISWALHLHLSLPADRWPCFELSCLRSLASVLFDECRREEFLADSGINGSEVDTLGSSTHAASLAPHVQELLRSAIYLLLKADEIREHTIDGCEADRSDEADSSAPRKRRRLSLMSDVSSVEPSPSKLGSRSNSQHVTISLVSLVLSFQQYSFMGDLYHLHLITLLHTMSMSASFLFTHHVDQPVALDPVVQHIKALAAKGKTVNRVVAFNALSSMARAFLATSASLSQNDRANARGILASCVSVAWRCVLDETEVPISRAALETICALLDADCCSDELDLDAVLSRVVKVCRIIAFVGSVVKSESNVKQEATASSVTQICDGVAFIALASLSRAFHSRNDGVDHRKRLMSVFCTLLPNVSDDLSSHSIDHLIRILITTSFSLTAGRSTHPVIPVLSSLIVHATSCEFDLVKLQSSSFDDLFTFSQQANSLKWVQHPQSKSAFSTISADVSTSQLSVFLSTCNQRAVVRLDVAGDDLITGMSSAVAALGDLTLLDAFLIRKTISSEARDSVFDIVKLCLDCLSAVLRVRDHLGSPSKLLGHIVRALVRLLARSESGWINFECSNQLDLQQSMARLFGAVEQLIVDALPTRVSRDVVMLDGDMDVEFGQREPAQEAFQLGELVISASDFMIPCMVHGFRANSTSLNQAFQNVSCDHMSVSLALLFVITLNDFLSLPDAVWSTALNSVVKLLDSKEVAVAFSARRRVLTLTPSPAPRRQPSHHDDSCTPDRAVIDYLHAAMFVLRLENLLADCGIDPPDFDEIQTNAAHIFTRFDALRPHPSSHFSVLHTVLHLLTSLRGLDSGVNEDSNAWARPTTMFDILEKHPSLTCKMIAANGISALIERATDQKPAWLQSKDRLYGIIVAASATNGLSDLIAAVSCLTACCVKDFEWESQCLSLLLNACASKSNDANHFIHCLTLTSIQHIADRVNVTQSELLQSHMSYILGQMLSVYSVNNLPIHALTGEIYSDHSVAAFCKKHLGTLCGAVLAASHKPQEEFDRLHKLSGVTRMALFVDHLPALTATCFALQAMPHTSDSHNSTAASARTFLESVLKKQMIPLFDRNRVAIVVSLCELCASVNGAPSLLNFGTAELETAVSLFFQSLARADTQAESISSFLTRPNLNLALPVLLSFRSNCVAETRRHRFNRWLDTFRAFLAMMGQRIVLTYLARAAVDLAVVLVFHPCADPNKVTMLLTDIILSIISSCATKSSRHGEVSQQELASLVSFSILTLAQWAHSDQSRVASASQMLDKIILAVTLDFAVDKLAHFSLLSEVPMVQQSPECARLWTGIENTRMALDKLRLETESIQKKAPQSLQDKLCLPVLDPVEQVFDHFIKFAEMLSTQPHSGSIIVAVQQLQVQAGRPLTSGSNKVPCNTRQVFALLSALSRESVSEELRLAVCGAISELGLLDIQLRNEFQILEYFQPVKADSSSKSDPSSSHSAASSSNGLSLASPAWFARWYRVGDGLPVSGVSCKPFDQVPQFHKHLHFHALCMQLLILGMRSSVPTEAWAAYRTLIRLFASQECTEEAKRSYQIMAPESQVSLAPFFTLASSATDLKTKGDLAKMLIRSAMAEEPHSDENSIKSGVDQWLFESTETVNDWLVGIARSLMQHSCSDHVLKFLDPCLTHSSGLAEHILPFIVFDVLQSLDVAKRHDLAASINRSIASALAQDSEAGGLSVPMQCMTTIIRCINYAREQQLIILRQPSLTPQFRGGTDRSVVMHKLPQAPSVVMLNSYDLEEHIDSFMSEINLLTLARVAVRLGRPATALGYTELWARTRPQYSDESEYHTLLLSIYRSMDDSDGIGYASLSLFSSLHSAIEAELVVNETEQRWDRALAIHSKQHNSEGVSRSLRLMQYTIDQPNDHSIGARDRRSETAWREAKFGNGHSNDDTDRNDTSFNIALHRSLSLLDSRVNSEDEGASTSLVSALRSAQHTLVRSQTTMQHERPAVLTPFLVRLQIIRAVESIAQSSDATHRESRARHLFETFHARTGTVISTFDQIEQLPAALTTLFRICSLKLVVPHLRAVSALARQAHRPIAALDAILTAEGLLKLKSNKLAEFHLRVELARQAESEKEIQRGVHALKLIDRQLSDIRTDQPSTELPSLKSEVNWLIGDFSHAQNMDDPQNIDHYFTRALGFSESTKLAARSNDQHDSSVWLWRLPSSHDQRVRLYRALGDLHDQQFQALHQKNISPEFQRKRDLIAELQVTLDRLKPEIQNIELKIKALNVELKARNVKSKTAISEAIADAGKVKLDLQDKQRKANQNQTTESQEIAENEKHMSVHVKKAFNYYRDYLARCATSKPDTLIVYRFCALMFDHHRLLDSDALKSVSSIPCYVFLPLVYQIASRLNSPANEFQTVISSLVEQLCIVHPFHTYAPVFALSYGDHTSSVGHGSATGFETNHERIAGAKNVIAKLKENPKSSSLCNSFERTIDAYIGVGCKEFTTRKDKTLSVGITPLGKLSIRHQRNTHIPTVPIAIRPDGNYKDLFVYTQAIDDPIAFASTGINRPLIVTLLGSDGKRHKLLVKPSDDLRQDAVMEQVFTLLNERLASRPDPRINRLRMRNYTIVPLTPGVGLVEFVNNSMTLFDCLVEAQTGAHPRHRAAMERQFSKKLLDSQACSAYMRDVHLNHSNADNRVQIAQQRYDEICELFPPVFGRAMIDLFPSPAAWIRARGLYTRSLACSSMVGYILSIGDRHPHNIMIDSSSAELIHIDFGIAFDMGKSLRTPELVPFRLTRDLVDGLGITGTEGEFRQSCERTLSLLRDNSSLLDTVLDVFVHDPLYRWSTNNTKQDMPGDATLDGVANGRENFVRSPSYGRAAGSPAATLGAQRAINGVRARLRGDDPTLSHGQALSVAGQVSGLIQLATDPKLLSKMYFGWSAWM